MVARKKKGLRPRTASSLRKYGLTVQQWQEMLDAQGGRCLLCRKGGLTKHLSVDHDHTLEKLGVMWVRGLLCQRCNRALAAWEWDEEVLERAAQYLQRISLTRAERRANVVHTSTDRGPVTGPRR